MKVSGEMCLTILQRVKCNMHNRESLMREWLHLLHRMMSESMQAASLEVHSF